MHFTRRAPLLSDTPITLSVWIMGELRTGTSTGRRKRERSARLLVKAAQADVRCTAARCGSTEYNGDKQAYQSITLLPLVRIVQAASRTRAR